jgi:Flp pilus assembly protein TadG
MRIMSRAANRGARRHGAALVEVALTLPIFLLLVLGILEYGRYMFVKNVVEHAVREGARYAVVHTYDKETADVEAFVQTRVSGIGTSLQGMEIEVFEANPTTGAEVDDWKNAAFGEMIAVRIHGDYLPVIRGLLFLPESIPMDHLCMLTSEAN